MFQTVTIRLFFIEEEILKKWQKSDHEKNLILEQRQSPVSRFAKSFAFVKKYQDFSE